jgi:VWFA-related protein
MRSIRALQYGIILLGLVSTKGSIARAQQVSSDVPTIQVTSRLVFLDVTVLDKKGRPVVNGLTKDDFTITDDKKPQRIFSFEAPETHVVDANTTDDDSAGNAPVTIFVLDLLNSKFEDFAYIRYMVRKYLSAQPAQLSSPAELMVLENESLEMVQGYTRSKADLLYALDHVPPVLPYKEMNRSYTDERFYQSIDALEQIALQNKGVRGRKNIVWVGHGGPNISTIGIGLPPETVASLYKYVHEATNMLVDSRVSLFVIYPGLKVDAPFIMTSALDASVAIGDDDPFSGDINFGVLVNETGGNLFYNRNDIDTEIKQSEELGSKYYTLTYQPPSDADADGKFRRIRVTLRDPNLHVVTKAGYFSLDKNAVTGPWQQMMVNLSEAARSSIPFESLWVTLEHFVRHPDTGTAEFTVLIGARNLDWQPADDGKSSLDLFLAAASLSESRDVLASKLEEVPATANNQDATRLAKTEVRLPMKIRIPGKTQSVRVVIETASNGRTGTIELDRKTIDAAPAALTPEPKLIIRRRKLSSTESSPTP